MRLWFWCLVFMVGICTTTYAQQPADMQVPIPVQSQLVFRQPVSVLDSVVAATKAHERFMRDSATMQYIKAPDSAMYREYVKHVLDSTTFKGNFLSFHQKLKSALKEGHHRQTRDQWVVFLIIGLLLYTGLINLILNKDVKAILYSFYNKRIVSQAGKGE